MWGVSDNTSNSLPFSTDRTFPVIFSGREVMAAAASKWAIFVGNFGNLDRFAGRLRFPWRENWDFFVRKFADLEQRGFGGTWPICPLLGENGGKSKLESES